MFIEEGVVSVINELWYYFDWIICDSLVGIECGVMLVMCYVDEVIIVFNLEVFFVCDCDWIIGFLDVKIMVVE